GRGAVGLSRRDRLLLGHEPARDHELGDRRGPVRGPGRRPVSPTHRQPRRPGPDPAGRRRSRRRRGPRQRLPALRSPHRDVGGDHHHLVAPAPLRRTRLPDPPNQERHMTTTDRTGSLTDLRVVDLSHVLSGPLAGQMLPAHGAHVIKVEPPAGDYTRWWGPPFFKPGHSAYFDGLNRNTRNISVDLRTDEGQALLRRMLGEADVVIENFKAGTLTRWGLSDEVLAEEFPRLIRCRITGYGVDGPLGGAPGYDAVLQALSGLMSINGEADGPEMRIGIPLVDIITSLNAMSGIL